MLIDHALPGVGPSQIRLYAPADALYELLSREGEIRRLNSLRHLGTLSQAHPGTRLARWDYTVAMLHYVNRIATMSGTNNFTLGNIEFSSNVAALQTLALVWNVGHLPGTFAVEKGVYRFLLERSFQAPTRPLLVRHREHPRIAELLLEGDRLLRDEDYYGLCRILAAAKLLGMADDAESLAFRIAASFYWPIVSNRVPEPSPRWARLRELFKVIRHVAYLTLDCPFTGIPWLPSIPALVDQLVAGALGDLRTFVFQVCEVLSPVERATAHSIYHSLPARANTAWVAADIHAKLLRSNDAAADIDRWLKSGLMRVLHVPLSRSRGHIGCMRIRSLFHWDNKQPAQLERELLSSGFSNPLVLRYSAWNSDALLEPDEIVVDAFSQTEVTGRDIGKLLAWSIGHFEGLTERPKELDIELLHRRDMVPSYLELLERAINQRIAGIKVRLEVWDLTVLGIRGFEERPPWEGGIWASNSRLDDALTRRILRRHRNIEVPARWQHQAEELRGLAILREWLRRTWGAGTPRRRWLLVPAGVRIVRDKKDLIEFDGGIVEISMRSGAINWWGLETKRGRENPRRSLERRLRRMKVLSAVYGLSTLHAVCKVSLDNV